MRSFIKIVDRANKGLEVFVGLALASMTVLIFFQVLVRFVLPKINLQISAPWTEELARYLMIWATFIGGAIVVRKADALAVEALVLAVPAYLGRKIKYLAHILSLIFYVLIFILGCEWAIFGLSELSPVLNVSMIYVYAAMSVGAALTIVNATTLLLETYVDKKDILNVIDFEMEEAIADAENALIQKKDGASEVTQPLADFNLAMAGNKEGPKK